jgi:hypothetical protein
MESSLLREERKYLIGLYRGQRIAVSNHQKLILSKTGQKTSGENLVMIVVF